MGVESSNLSKHNFVFLPKMRHIEEDTERHEGQDQWGRANESKTTEVFFSLLGHNTLARAIAEIRPNLHLKFFFRGKTMSVLALLSLALLGLSFGLQIKVSKDRL